MEILEIQNPKSKIQNPKSKIQNPKNVFRVKSWTDDRVERNSFQIVLSIEEEEVDSFIIIYSRRFVRRINTYTFVLLWGRIYTKSWALVALLPKVILKRFFCVFPRFYRCSSYVHHPRLTLSLHMHAYTHEMSRLIVS